MQRLEAVYLYELSNLAPKQRNQEMELVDGLLVQRTKLDDRKDRSLPFDQFFFAKNRYLELLKAARPSDKVRYTAFSALFEDVTDMWNHQPVLAPIYLSSVMAASVADSSLDISNRQAAIYSYAAAEAATSIAQTMNSAASAVSSHKRPHDSSGPFQPRNRPSGRPAQGDLSQVQCFRCGNKGHIVSTCSASTTIAGKPSLQIRTGSRGLLVDAASGKDICLKFNRNQCFDNSCPRAHLCPLDGQPHSIVDQHK